MFAARPSSSAETLTEQVLQRLHDDILACRLRPGEKLRLETLRETYAVGASPLREALSRLASTGLVVAEGQRGFRVAPVSIDDLLDLAKTRLWVERVALRAAIARGDRNWEANILACGHRLGIALPSPGAQRGPEDDWDVRHREFHASLVSACGSNYLLGFWRALFDAAVRYRNWKNLNLPSDRDRRSEAGHRAIMNAVLARDAGKAVELMHAHMLLMPRTILALDPRTAGDADRLIARLLDEVDSVDCVAGVGDMAALAARSASSSVIPRAARRRPITTKLE